MKREEFLSQFKDVDLELLTTKILIHILGVPANRNGYRYLRTSIVYAVRDPEITNAVTKTLYPVLSGMYKVSTGSVEGGIRYVIEDSWERRDKEKCYSIFGKIVNEDTRPSNTEYIRAVSEYLYYLLLEKESGENDKE